MSYQGKNLRGNPEGTEIGQRVTTFFNDNAISDQVKAAFMPHILLRLEDTFQWRFSTKWSSIRTMDSKNWMPGFLSTLMKWSRACWINRLQHLFSSRKDWYRLQRNRLHLQVNIWYNAPREEVMIDRSMLSECAIILRKNNYSPIAKWIDWLNCRYEDRAEAMKDTDQTTGQMWIIRFVRPVESRRQHNRNFQTRLQDARRTTLPTSSNTVDGGRLSEDFRLSSCLLICYYFPLLI